MRKHWFAAVFAALLVVGAGTAVASIPSGSETSFSVSDPAVTVIASGGGGEGGSYSSGTTMFVPAPGGAATFTAAADGVCLVNLNGQLLGVGRGAKAQYGVAQRIGSGKPEFVGYHSLTTTLGDFSGTDDAADLAKNELVPIEGGKTYTFGFGVEVAEGSGTAYPSENYVCFGA
jgi:hypothetical protein